MRAAHPKTSVALLLCSSLAAPIGCGEAEAPRQLADDALGRDTAASAGTEAPVSPAAGAAGSGTAERAEPAEPMGEVALPPCDVTAALARNCHECHGATPIGGAPMPLLVRDDFLAAAVTQPSLKVHELARMRLNRMGNVMPPGGQITTEDFRLLDDWLAEGAPGATIGDAECEAAAAGSPTPPTGSPHGEAPGDPATDPSATHPDETCYDFPVHGQPIAGDTSTYSISSGEHYQVFYFKAPWAAGSLATYYGSVFDNVAVLHHWLMYGTSLDRAEGAIEPGSGSHIGQGATLLAGWAVGGREVRLPEGVGLRLLAPETTLLIE